MLPPSILRVFLLSCLALPPTAYGAVYKCTVDGKTAYQQQPCEAGAAQREVEPPPARPSRATAAPSPAAEPARPGPSAPRKPVANGELDAAGREALAREAFEALKRRDLASFDALLCANARQNYARAELRSVLPRAAAGIAKRQTELGETLVNESSRVNFATTIIEPGRSDRTRVPDRPFGVGLRRPADGRTCVDGFGSLAGSGK